MWKWASWIVRMGATALMLSFLCIWTTGYIVNSYMESVIKQLDLPIDTKPFALSGVWGTLWGVDDPAKEAKDEPSSSPSGESSDEASAAYSADPSPSEQEDEAIASPSPTPSEEPSVEAGESGEQTGNGDAIPVLGEEANGANLTDEERQQLYGIVVSKLKPEQLNQLSEALKGGMTTEETSGVDAMLKSALTEAEYEQMMALLQGASSGEDTPPPQ